MTAVRASIWELVIPFLIVVLVWSATLAGWFALPQGVLYDAAVLMTPPGGDAGQDLLMVEVDSSRSYDGGVWSRAVTLLEKSEPAQILFLFMPSDASSAFYEHAVKAGNVRFGRRLVPGPLPVLEPIPDSGRGIPFATGVLAHPSPTYGMYRELRANVIVQGQPHPSLVLEAARAVHGPGFTLPEDPFLLNFMARPALLPKVSLAQLLDGALVPEVIRGRTVVIGFGAAPGGPGLQTPINPNRESMSLFDFEGYALDTVLRAGPLDRPRGIEVPACLALLGLAVFFVFQRLPLALGLGAAMLMLPAVGAGTWACAILFQVWLPLAQCWTVILLVFLQVVLFRNMREDGLVRAMLLERSIRLQKVLMPAEAETSEVNWDDIMTLVDQALNVNRSIFLERVPGQNRVREVVALRCSIDDFEERRRDIGRAPYVTALEGGEPILLRDRLVLREGKNPGAQYLVALRYAGRTLGFWALEIRQEAIESQPGLVALIQAFAAEIGELLAQHQKRRETRRTSLLRLAGGKRVRGLERLNQDLHMLEKRLVLLDGVFQSMGTATILYDLFGRVVQINESMSGLLRQADLPPFAMSGLDLAARLSGRPLEEMRTLLADTIVSGGTHTLSVSHPTLGRQSLLLSFRALERGDRGERGDDSSPFAVFGILFEVVDAAAVRDAEEIRKRFVEEAVSYLQQGVESFQDACTLRDSGEEDTGQLPDMETQKERLLTLLNRFERFARTDMLNSVTGQYPVDPMVVLAAAWESFDEESRAGKVTLEYPSRKGALVMTAPGGLESCLKAVFAFLINDCVEGSRIVVRLRESDTSTVLDILGTGFGMPGEEFERLFNDPKLPASPEFDRIRGAASLAGQWGGTLTGSSELGKGTAFRLRMSRFLPFTSGGDPA